MNKTFGGILLIAGTTIGAGMLALPVVTGFAGFIPTVAVFIIYWLYMTYTAFLLLEVNLWMGENINLITMVKYTLGKKGEIVAWAAYLLLLYLLTTAYLAGGGPIIADFIGSIIGKKIPGWMGAIPLLLIFGFTVFEGTKYVDYVNRFCMLALVISYGAMMLFLLPHIEPVYLTHFDGRQVFLAVSLLATSFGFHIVIPTLSTYLHRDITQLKKVILYGSLIPLVVYIIWECATLGTIPLETIKDGYEQGHSGVKLIVDTVQSPKVGIIAQAFSFFAIITSFLGVTMSLNDFLADGFHIKKSVSGKVILFGLTFIPPLLFILTYPRAFISALEFAGVYGVIILLGLLPPLMVWVGRYRKSYEAEFVTPGGKGALIAAIVFSLLIIGIEIGQYL